MGQTIFYILISTVICVAYFTLVGGGCGCRCHRVSFSLKGIWGKYVKLDQALS